MKPPLPSSEGLSFCTGDYSLAVLHVASAGRLSVNFPAAHVG